MMMLSIRHFAAFVVAVVAVATVSGQQDASNEALQYQRQHAQQRRKLTWNFFGFLMMMVSGECGPASHIHLGDHHLCHECTGVQHNMNACNTLCSMSDSDPRKSHYSRFCDSKGGSSSGSSSYSANAANDESDTSSSYSGSTTSGSIGTGGANFKGFQWWMLATGAAVVMAMAAIHIGQRKDYSRYNADRSMMNGAVGRRFTAVTAFAKGIFPTKPKATVEMVASGASGGYQLDTDDATAPVDADNLSTSSPEELPAEDGKERSYKSYIV